jgi:CO/xanthine dehydrogenase FAD-binding subunit
MLRGARVDDGSVDRAGAALLAELRPIDDVRSTAAYRRQVAVNVFAEFLQFFSR